MTDSPHGPKAAIDWTWVALGLIILLVAFIIWEAYDMGIIG